VPPVPGRAGLLRRTALTSYARLPRRVRLALLHLIAPSHTVGALCFVEHEGQVLLLRQHHRRGWTLPGGLVNRGEDAAQAVEREVREETGLAVQVGLPFATVVEPRARRVDVLFHVRVDGDRPPVSAGSEAIQASWLVLAEAGPVDDPTAGAFAMFDRSRDPRAYQGRLAGEG
jgi:8-oxo-dGTP diphosphatase